MANVYDTIPVPSLASGDTFTDSELLYSYAGFSQKGVTLAGGQGILPIGCVLGRKTSDKKYYPYNNSNSDGTEVARGILRRSVDTGTGGTAKDVLGNIVIAGILKLSLISGSDSAALTDLNAVSDSVRGTFKF